MLSPKLLRSGPVGWLAVGQLCSTKDVENNFRLCAELVDRAKQRNCSLLCLPEGTQQRYNNKENHLCSKRALGIFLDLNAFMSMFLNLGGGDLPSAAFDFVGEAQPDALAMAQPLDGPLMSRYCDLAKKNGCCPFQSLSFLSVKL